MIAPLPPAPSPMEGRAREECDGSNTCRSTAEGTVPTAACDQRFATADLTGQRVLGWVSCGKHLLMRTDAAITVHSHLRMSGRWTGLGKGKRLPPC
jgi:endonuclease-8